ncbi:serpin I2-like isoform X2 [Actinia tenebrosa]|uniref:Serpin I2-like isoform X2 n=1 Tax=Actinia tenebrosa TaxID=6105 RepID=A0A6P8INZ3_ACTTE|nr:serpin I2-like isoform X2 [Actinia tenebrosa]
MATEQRRGFAAVFFALSLIVHADGALISASPAMASNSKAAQSCNNLGIQLYLILSSGDNNNVVFSPIGLAMAIETTKLGVKVRRKTLEELNELLELNSRALFKDMKKLHEQIIDKRKDGVHVKFENTLLGKDDFKMRVESTNYKLQGNEVMRDFRNGDTRRNLVNKAVFKAHWEIPFSVFKRSSFFIPRQKGISDKEVQVDFMGLMSDENQLNYFNDGKYRCQVIELNYGKDFVGDSWDPRYTPADVSMVIVLPYEDQSLRTLEERLWPGTIERWVSKLELTNIDVSIPKFNISILLDAGVSLKELGVHSIFTKRNSDLCESWAGKRQATIYMAGTVRCCQRNRNRESPSAFRGFIDYVDCKS